MHANLLAPPSSIETIKALWAGQPDLLRDRGLLYLVIAGVCLIVALRLVKRALAQIGAMVQAVAAAAMVAFAIGAALGFLTTAAFSGR